MSARPALRAAGTVPSFLRLIWAPVSEWRLTLAAVTAPFFSCLVPTLLLGSVNAA
ncbi:MAG: hypothetical protein ACXVTC_02885 [Solirubrobacteraceae bacterium]